MGQTEVEILLYRLRDETLANTCPIRLLDSLQKKKDISISWNWDNPLFVSSTSTKGVLVDHKRDKSCTRSYQALK